MHRPVSVAHSTPQGGGVRVLQVSGRLGASGASCDAPLQDFDHYARWVKHALRVNTPRGRPWLAHAWWVRCTVKHAGTAPFEHGTSPSWCGGARDAEPTNSRPETWGQPRVAPRPTPTPCRKPAAASLAPRAAAHGALSASARPLRYGCRRLRSSQGRRAYSYGTDLIQATVWARSRTWGPGVSSTLLFSTYE